MNPVTENELKTHQEKIGGKRVTLDALKANIAKADYYLHPDTQLTICILTLQNGFTVTGESACADPAMFNAEIGQKIARENAERKIWPLMGYALKEEMMKEIASTDFRERVKAEARQLQQNIAKLDAFMGGSVHWDTLHPEDQQLMSSQRTFMAHYYDVLMARISRFD